MNQQNQFQFSIDKEYEKYDGNIVWVNGRRFKVDFKTLSLINCNNSSFVLHYDMYERERIILPALRSNFLLTRGLAGFKIDSNDVFEINPHYFQ